MKTDTTTNITTTITATKSPVLSCKLTTPQLQERKQTVIASLRNQVQEKKELTNGYAYKFENSDTLLDELTTFIKTERMCCDFFSFELKVKPDESVWLQLTGPQGAKAFIETEIQL
ncbi:hypothetical protein [Xanthocytophaga flava]|uniref:hypothetical protein n=1 Tax=Xanthocytophaga flava TaxID=3048013 RepID=UPI0028D2C122|nr:hypothetical protein [Xanthocytophaga flavus]MDJ1470177.1 hypothetical protein [Xanthocytophaga flavus]